MGVAADKDVEKLCGMDQLCSGLRAGIEGAVHAMLDLIEETSGNGWGLPPVDAFNSVNREAALAESKGPCSGPGAHDSYLTPTQDVI